MDFELPLWSIPLGTLAFTSIFFLGQHMNYDVYQWIVGNGIIAMGIGIIYIGDFAKRKWE